MSLRSCYNNEQLNDIVGPVLIQHAFGWADDDIHAFSLTVNFMVDAQRFLEVYDMASAVRDDIALPPPTADHLAAKNFSCR